MADEARRFEELIRIVEIWQTQKKEVFKRNPYHDGASVPSMTEFAQIQTSCARRLVSIMERQDDDFYESLIEIATQVGAVLRGAKTFVDKQDVTHAIEGNVV